MWFAKDEFLHDRPNWSASIADASLRSKFELFSQRQVFESASVALIVSALLVLAILCPHNAARGNALVEAPLMGTKLLYLNRLQFLFDAKTPIQEGYEKVNNLSPLRFSY